jgi:ribosomal protein S18 acetylase RimI-like enzyme
MINVVIRAMSPSDRSAVIALLIDSEPWKRLGYAAQDWDHYFSPIPQGRDSYVVDQAGKLAGVAVLRQKFLLGDYLELFGVADWTRGKGIGKMLLAHIESVVFARAKNLFACVSDFNEPARRFYQKHGYEEIGHISNLLIAGSAEILLRKTIGPARVER